MSKIHFDYQGEPICDSGNARIKLSPFVRNVTCSKCIDWFDEIQGVLLRLVPFSEIEVRDVFGGRQSHRRMTQGFLSKQTLNMVKEKSNRAFRDRFAGDDRSAAVAQISLAEFEQFIESLGESSN